LAAALRTVQLQLQMLVLVLVLVLRRSSLLAGRRRCGLAKLR
jgi:hypothetical protein